MVTVGPYHGEFGLKVRFWVPQVQAVRERNPDITVVHEVGEEALFPGFHNRQAVRCKMSHQERARLGRPPTITNAPGVRFIPEPWAYQALTVQAPDVVICPRFSLYGQAKNWDGWLDLASFLVQAGVRTTAAGTADGSYPVPAHDYTWTYHRTLDATIQAIRAARLVVATDAGLAHLAVLCGADLLLVTYRGRVAPGPVIDSSGSQARGEYWPVRWEDYYQAANHAGARLYRVDGWEYPNRVARWVLTHLNGGDSGPLR